MNKEIVGGWAVHTRGQGCVVDTMPHSWNLSMISVPWRASGRAQNSPKANLCFLLLSLVFFLVFSHLLRGDNSLTLQCAPIKRENSGRWVISRKKK